MSLNVLPWAHPLIKNSRVWSTVVVACLLISPRVGVWEFASTCLMHALIHIPLIFRHLSTAKLAAKFAVIVDPIIWATGCLSYWAYCLMFFVISSHRDYVFVDDASTKSVAIVKAGTIWTRWTAWLPGAFMYVLAVSWTSGSGAARGVIFELVKSKLGVSQTFVFLWSSIMHLGNVKLQVCSSSGYCEIHNFDNAEC